MSNGDLGWITNFIWGIADDVLRDLYVRGKYRDVILPMTVLRRLDAVLEPILGRQQYLLADSGFSLADLNVASVASVLPVFQISLSNHPNTDQWMKRCFSRDAWRRVMERP